MFTAKVSKYWRIRRAGNSCPGPQIACHNAATVRGRRSRFSTDVLRLECLEDRCVPAALPVLVQDLNPGIASSNPKEFVQSGDLVLFSGASPQASVDGLWRTGGVDGSTTFLKDLNRNSFDFKAAGSQVFFWQDFRRQLWRTNGTEAGTSLVREFLTINTFYTTGSFAYAPTAVAGVVLYFPGEYRYYVGSYENPLWLSYGIEPYWVDGQSLAPTVDSAELNELPTMGSSPQAYTEFGGSMYFTARGIYNSVGRQLWKSPGPADAGVMVFNPSSDGSMVDFGELEAAGAKLFFTTADNKLRLTDGTAAGTQLVTTLSKPLQNLTGVGDRVFMTAAGNTAGSIELWSSDGTAAGTAAFATLTGPSTSSFSGYFVVGNHAFFVWDDGQTGRELWVTDGSAGGTHLVKDIRPGSVDSAIVVGSANRADPVAYDNLLYFVADDGVHGAELWRSDGFDAELVVDSKPGPDAGSPSWLTPIEGALYLNMFAPAVGYEPFVIGTPSFVRPKDDLVGRVEETGDWYVGTSDGTQFSTSYWSTWAPGAHWVDVQTGDFNGDGKSDIVGRVGDTGEWYVGLATGSGFATSYWGQWTGGAVWADVMVGDFDGDGLDDVAGRYLDGGDWYVARSIATEFSTSLWGDWDANLTWVDVRTGDFNGDGRTDILGRNIQFGGWYQGLAEKVATIGVPPYRFRMEQVDVWTSHSSVTWADIRVADFNGDGRDDFIGRWAETGQWWLKLALAATHIYWGSWSPGITWADVRVGDFNGDRRADLIGRWAETGQWWVGESTGASMQNRYFGQWTATLTWVDVRIGDYDGDGRDDLLGRWKETGQWYVGRSNGSGLSNSLWAVWSSNIHWVDAVVADFA